MYKKVLTPQEVAQILGLSQSYTYELLRNQTIPNIRLGGKILISKKTVNELLTTK